VPADWFWLNCQSPRSGYPTVRICTKGKAAAAIPGRNALRRDIVLHFVIRTCSQKSPEPSFRRLLY